MKVVLLKLRRFFCTFSGEDDFIIGRSDTKTQVLFSLIGFFVSLIFVSCLWSSYLFISNMFHNDLTGASISLIVALIFTNLYLLILYTISPPLLPAKRPVSTKSGKINYKNEHVSVKSNFIGFSLLLRLGLLLLIALFIVQPINVLIFSGAPNHYEYAKEIKDVLNHHKLIWLTNTLACLIFLFPVYWKYMIRNNTDFYLTKREVEHDLVLKNYSVFKELYSNILSEFVDNSNKKVKLNLEYYLNELKKVDIEQYNLINNEIVTETRTETIHFCDSNWIDPPFKTRAKENEVYSFSEEDFLKTIYPENN